MIFFLGTESPPNLPYSPQVCGLQRGDQQPIRNRHSGSPSSCITVRILRSQFSCWNWRGTGMEWSLSSGHPVALESGQPSPDPSVEIHVLPTLLPSPCPRGSSSLLSSPPRLPLLLSFFSHRQSLLSLSPGYPEVRPAATSGEGNGQRR